jgi:hypothetical protein
MKPIHVRSFVLSALTVWTFGSAVASAQDTSPALLNALEVQRLVARSAPGDHVQLSAHFTAVADNYAAEAKRHTSMSRGAVGNPSRSLVTSLGAHCKRLAELNTESATALRELAAHHLKLSAGASAPAPAAGARFEAGAGARVPTDQELSALAGSAQTPAEHGALEAYFVTLAKRYSADADAHAALAKAYRGGRFPQVAVHCERAAKLARDAANEANAAAAMHRTLAGGGR